VSVEGEEGQNGTFILWCLRREEHIKLLKRYLAGNLGEKEEEEARELLP